MLPTKTPIRLSVNGGAPREAVASPYSYKIFPKRANPSIRAIVAGREALVALTGGKGRAADGRTRFYFYATPADAPESARGALSLWVELTPAEASALLAAGATLLVEPVAASVAAPVVEPEPAESSPEPELAESSPEPEPEPKRSRRRA